MGIHEVQTPQHWNFLLALESDISNIARFIEPTKSNEKTYSLELARILFAASSEIDVVAQQLCGRLKSEQKAKNMNEYRQIIKESIPRIHETQVSFPKYGLRMQPWGNWKGEENPVWWKGYNKVKHERHNHYDQANLKNALNSVAALYVLTLFLYQEEAEKGQLAPNVTIMTVEAPFVVDYLEWSPTRTAVYNFRNFF